MSDSNDLDPEPDKVPDPIDPDIEKVLPEPEKVLEVISEPEKTLDKLAIHSDEPDVLKLKDQDVIKLTSDTEELNGYFLIDSITNDEVHLKQPNKNIKLDIIDNRIQNVNTVTLVYSSSPVGYAQTRELLPNKRVTITFTDHEEQFNGLIVSLEKDRIEVAMDNGKTIYIDFNYTTIPFFIAHIELEDNYVFEEGQYYFLPDSQHRFTLEIQLIDLMDALLSKKQTPRVIQTAIRTVKRFRELLHLFSNDAHERISILNKPLIHPYEVKWIVPITKTLNRIIYGVEESEDYVNELVQIQKQQLFLSDSKRILELMNPFTVESGATSIIQHTLPMLLKGGKYYKDPLKKGKNKLANKDKPQKPIRTKDWMVQVLTEPYELFSTIPERTTVESYMTQPEYMIQYTRGYVPSTTLIEKVNSNFIAPFSKIASNGSIHENIEECVPSIETILNRSTLFYSIQPYVKQASPFLVYKSNIGIDKTKNMFKRVQSNITSYTKIYKSPPYIPNPLHEIDTLSASEWQVRLLHEDNGNGYALHKSKHFKLSKSDPGLFKLKEEVTNVKVYNTEEDYTRTIDGYERQNHKRMHSFIQIKKKMETKYNDAFATLHTDKVAIASSPKTSLLLYILQKPYVERYTELKQFIRRNTRPAFKLEDQEWFYCKVTNLKLIPKLFEVLIEAFENDTYADTLNKLHSEDKVKTDGSNLYLNGLPVSGLRAEDRYDDIVRSSELIEDEIYEYRDDDPRTESIALLLNHIGQLIQVDLAKYMNLMIYETLQETEKEIIIIHSIAIVLKIANVIQQIDVGDALQRLMKSSAKIALFIRKLKVLGTLELNESHIRKAITVLSKRPSIQRLETRRVQKKVEKTDSTLWPTFLPPLLHLSKHQLGIPMQIIYDIQETVKDAATLDHFPKVNTIPIPFLRDHSILARIPPKVFPFYDVNVKVKFQSDVLQHPDKDPVTFLQIAHPDIVPPRFIPYDEKLGLLKAQERQEKVPILFKKVYTVTLSYLRTFIQNIARTFPNILIHTGLTRTIIPLSIHELISPGHNATLFGKLESQYQFINISYNPAVLRKIIEDEEIAACLRNLHHVTNEDSYIEYEYYLLFIYDKYKQFDAEESVPQYIQTTKLLDAFTETFTNNNILLTYEEIQKYVLTKKATESNGIVDMRNAMTSADRYIFDFRQTQNISLDAQIGRIRTYDERRHDNESIWAEEHPDEADLGVDGNDEAENNDGA
jgi:hypothetical protein